MVTRVVVSGRGVKLAAMMIRAEKVTFELLRGIFACPMRITHERNSDTWHIDLDAAELMEEQV